MAVAAVAYAAHGHDLLRGGAEMVDLSLVATRARSAARRAAEGTSDARDAAALETMARVFDEAAHRAKQVARGQRLTSHRSGSLTSEVDLTLDVAAVFRPPSDHTALADLWSQVAADTRRLVADPTEAAQMSNLFADLATVVLRRTAHVGEVVERA